MSFETQKITGYASGIAALPDKVEGRAAWLKAQFDARTDSEVKTQHNALCDALAAQNAAESVGAKAPEGVAANPAPPAGVAASVQAVLQGLADQAAAHAARADNPHGVTAAQLDAYTRGQTDSAIAQRIVEIGAGDMSKSVYDPAGHGLPLLPQNGDGTQVTASFAAAEQDENLCTGESLGVLFGKLARWFATITGLQTQLSALGLQTQESLAQKANAAEMQTALAGKAAAAHTHDDRYFTESEVTTKLNGKANTAHTHDDRYFTESEVNTKLNGKANATHTHSKDQVGLSKVANVSTTMGYDGNLYLYYS